MSSFALTTGKKGLSAAADACAKINLTLEVLSRRDDGFHELRSLVIGVGLRDELRATLTADGGPSLTCSDPDLSGGDNLVIRALTELARTRGVEPSMQIDLNKRIPVGAGLGGGSSDAATALRLGNHLWHTGMEPGELATIGARVGSDVPVFFALPGALMSGRGEQVEPVKLNWAGSVLMVFAGPAVSTASVYQAWRPTDASRCRRDTTFGACAASTADELSEMLTNHLEPAVFRVSPPVAVAHAELDRLGFGPLRVSGAGSTLFRLFDFEEHATEIAREINELGQGLSAMVVNAPTGSGPVVSKED